MIFEVDALTLSESNSSVPTSACLNVSGQFQGGIVGLSLDGEEFFSAGETLVRGFHLEPRFKIMPILLKSMQ